MGGGAAGKISYPEYISVAHGYFIDKNSIDAPNISITEALNTALVNNPFIGEDAFDPESELAKSYADLTAFRTLVTSIDPNADYSSTATAIGILVNTLINDDYITSIIPTIDVDESALAADAASYADIQNDILENTILPPWKAGMHNINAVTSSAFVVGEAILRGMNLRDIARYTSSVRIPIVAKNTELNAAFITQRQDIIARYNVQRNEMIRIMTDSVMTLLIQKNSLTGQVNSAARDYAALHIASNFDQIEAQLEIEENEAKWEIGLFQPIASFLGALASGGGVGAPKKPSKAVSAISGAVGGASTGASIGASIGGGAAAGGSTGGIYGAVIGAVVGAGLALATY